jgi:hypothetical protein
VTNNCEIRECCGDVELMFWIGYIERVEMSSTCAKFVPNPVALTSRTAFLRLLARLADVMLRVRLKLAARLACLRAIDKEINR